MKPNQLATLVLRLLGVYCLIVFVPMVPLFGSVVFYARSSNDNSGIAVITLAVLFSIFWLGVGISLIVWSVPWGNKLTPKDIDEGNITTYSFEQIQILAFAIAGVLIFSDALPQLLNSFFSFFSSLNQVSNRSQPPAYSEFNWHSLLTAAGTLLKAALGLWLFFWRARLCEFLVVDAEFRNTEDAVGVIFLHGCQKFSADFFLCFNLRISAYSAVKKTE